MIDQRRMMPTQELHIIGGGGGGCLGDAPHATPTMPLTFSLVGVAYALCWVAGALGLRAYIARQIRMAIDRAIVPLMELKDIDMPDDQERLQHLKREQLQEQLQVQQRL